MLGLDAQMITRKVNRTVASQRPHEVWNAYVNLLATEDYADLDEVQRAAHLAFWYDSEVQNGGHLQYFENRGLSLVAETLKALRVIGAEGQHRVLEAASQAFLSKPRARIQTVEAYVATARHGEFDSYDSACYACEPPIQELLKDYLGSHRGRFVQFV